MPLPAILGSLLSAIGTGAKTLGTGALSAMKTMPAIGNNIGKGLVTGSKYIGQVAKNVAPLTQILSGYSGNSGQALQPQYIQHAPISSQVMESPYTNNSQNPYASSALARKLRGLL